MLDYSHLVGTIGLRAGNSIRQAITAIDHGTIGFALVLDASGRLDATLSDGDIRRAVLAGLSLTNTVAELLDHRKTIITRTAITAPLDINRGDLLRLMKKHTLRHIPLIDEQRVVRKLVTLEELVLEDESKIQALIMAGGAGTRLRPLTLDTPKPMLKLGDRPILEHILGRLKDAGIEQVNISTHYMPEKISSYFQDGTGHGVNINYVHEAQPLGTAGALSLIEATPKTILVMNGDILTDVDFRAMHAYHHEHGAALTVAVGIQETRFAYGVVECDGIRIQRIREKPTIRTMINAGIYLIEPHVCAMVEPGKPFDMPDLIAEVMRRGLPVIAFPLREGWIDIGTPEDYARAQEHMAARVSAPAS